MSIHGFDMVPMVKQKGFTLVEILIVVSILGILTAIIMPEFYGHTTKAKEVAAKEMLQMLRGQVELYTIQHDEMPPGYLDGNTSVSPVGAFMLVQLTYPTNITGQWAAAGTEGYDYGPYMNAVPKNPFNNGNQIWVITNDPTATEPSEADSRFGWLYYGPTKTIRLNTFGNDSTEMSYQDY